MVALNNYDTGHLMGISWHLEGDLYYWIVNGVEECGNIAVMKIGVLRGSIQEQLEFYHIQCLQDFIAEARWESSATGKNVIPTRVILQYNSNHYKLYLNSWYSYNTDLWTTCHFLALCIKTKEINTIIRSFQSFFQVFFGSCRLLFVIVEVAQHFLQ